MIFGHSATFAIDLTGLLYIIYRGLLIALFKSWHLKEERQDLD